MKFKNPFGFKKPKPVVATGRVIDMTKTTWGHSFYISHWWSDPADTCHILGWCSPRPKTGDIIMWDTAYGIAYAMFGPVEYYADPQDMFKADVTIVNRWFDDTL